MNGKPVWKKDLGLLDSGFFMVPDAQWGFASSPIIHDDRVIIQVDVQKGSFVAALDVATGSEIWRTPRNDVPTWSTPAVHVADGRAQVVVNGWKHIGGYDLATGKELWRMTGGGDIPVPTPIAGARADLHHQRARQDGADLRDQADGQRRHHAEGGRDRQRAHRVEPRARRRLHADAARLRRPALRLPRQRRAERLRRARPGSATIRARLADGTTGFSASAVASNGRIYFTSEEGDVYVVKAGPAFELLAVNPLGEVAMATPAISEGTMFFRTRGHLVAIAENRALALAAAARMARTSSSGKSSGGSSSHRLPCPPRSWRGTAPDN